jgi:hypothetical protein
MKRNKGTGFLFFCFAALLLSSCGKGYQVRFTNYYIEEMDSVIVGNNKIVFTDVKPEAATGYKKLSKGDYAILFITKTKKKFTGTINVPTTGTGKRTIEIDGITQVAILEQ